MPSGARGLSHPRARHEWPLGVFGGRLTRLPSPGMAHSGPSHPHNILNFAAPSTCSAKKYGIARQECPYQPSPFFMGSVYGGTIEYDARVLTNSIAQGREKRQNSNTPHFLCVLCVLCENPHF